MKVYNQKNQKERGILKSEKCLRDLQDTIKGIMHYGNLRRKKRWT